MLSALQNLGKKISHLFGDSSHELNALHPMSKFLPYETYDEELGLFLNKNSIGFAIEMLPLVGSDSATQKDISNIFDEIIEEGESIQCLLWSDNRIDSMLDFWQKPRHQMGGIYSKIANKRVEFLRNSNYFFPCLFRFVFSFSVPFSKDSQFIQKLQNKKEKCLRILRASSKSAHLWHVRDLLEFVGGMLNFSLETKSVIPNWNPYQTLASQIPKGGRLSIEDEQLRWSSSAFRTYRAVDFPESWSMLQMQHLIGDVERESYRLLTPFYLHYAVHCPKQQAIEQKLKTRGKLIDKQGQSSKLMQMIPQLEEELKEVQYARKELYRGARFVWTDLSVGMWSRPSDLIRNEQTLKGIFRNNRFSLAENTKVHLPQFLSALPMSLAEYVKGLKNLSLFRTTLTSECGNFVPMQAEWYGTLKSPGVLFTGLKNQLTNWNPFDNETGNYNVSVIGRSGSGKSVFMQEMLFNGLGTGAKVFVLDVGRSFDKFCHTLDGQFIEFSKESAICLNPFSQFPIEDSAEQKDCIIMLKSILANMADPINGLNSEQSSILEEAIKEAWMEKQNNATVSHVAHWLKKQNTSLATSLATMLFPYTANGVFGNYFEGQSNIDFTKPLVVIELEELKEKKDLQAVVLQLLMLTITNQAFLGDRKRRFHICFDEAWDLLRAKQTGPFIETLARRLRKYNGSLIVGTQQLEDFYTSPGALAAFSNSDWACFLPQFEGSIEKIQEKIKMPEGKVKAINSLNTVHGLYSEVLICQGHSYSKHRLWLDAFSNLLYSTQPNDYARVSELRSKGMNLEDTIEEIIRERTC